MRNPLERLFVRGGHVCPWWCCFTFDLLKPGGRFLLTEPAVHVTGKMFDRTVAAAKETGFVETARPRIFMSRSVLYVRKAVRA